MALIDKSRVAWKNYIQFDDKYIKLLERKNNCKQVIQKENEMF